MKTGRPKKYHTEEERRKAAVLNARKWQKANPNKFNEIRKRWNDNNIEKKKEYNRKWAKKNPDKVIIASIKWAKKNKAKCKEYQKKYYMKRNNPNHGKLIPYSSIAELKQYLQKEAI